MRIRTLITIVLLMGLAGTGAAQDSAVLPIKPVSPVSTSAQVFDVEETRDLSFDGIGSIDILTADDVVVDDSIYRLAKKGVEYLSKDGGPATKKSFKPGVTIAYRLNDKGEIDRLRLYE
jgi:hypothetical protein